MRVIKNAVVERVTFIDLKTGDVFLHYPDGELFMKIEGVDRTANFTTVSLKTGLLYNTRNNSLVIPVTAHCVVTS